MKIIDPAKELIAIRAAMGHLPSHKQYRYYLDLGDRDANNVFGHPDKGIRYGCQIEVSGAEQSGKSALAFDFLSAGQEDGAYGVWSDAENSLDKSWARKRGVDTDKLFHVYPYKGTFPVMVKGKKRMEERMSNAQELLAESEAYVTRVSNRDPHAKFIHVVDSITALLTKEEMAAGLVDQNMRTGMALPAFMSKLMRRWVGFSQATNMTVIFINQLRTNPTQMFGNPDYTPGGKAAKFYCHVRVGMRRVKGGRLVQSGEQIGIKGVAKNIKNKLGGKEFSEVGYKIMFKGSSEFLPADEMKKGEVENE